MTAKESSKSTPFLVTATEGSTASSRASSRAKARRAKVKCEHCHGRGYFTVGAGLASLQDKYPDLPMRAIQGRGWLGFPDEDNAIACDAAFLAFWGVDSHEELQRKQTERREFPWNARVAK